MRDMGVRGLLVFYADYRCSHSIAITITIKGAAPTGTWLLTCRCTLGQLQRLTNPASYARQRRRPVGHRYLFCASSQQMLRVANPTTLFAMADAGHERGYRRNRQFIRKIIVNAIPQFRSVRTMRWNWPELKTTIVRIALIASKSFA